MRGIKVLALIAVSTLGLGGKGPGPSISYVLRIDTARLDVAEVTMRVEGVPASTLLAMKVHPEYDAKYWRYLDSLRVDGTADDKAATITPVDSTLWRLSLPGGRGTIHYRIHIQTGGPTRRAWMPFARETGALINPPDFFLYLPNAVNVPVRVVLDVPPAWRVATPLAREGTGSTYVAPDAATLLDSPILLGNLSVWPFTDRGTAFHVAYWRLPNALPFDTAAFVDGLRRLAGAALDVFGKAPAADFWFLIQDGAGDALEHKASVTIGVPSAVLAGNPHARITEIGHEFFHAWNLVVIHPDHYGELSYRPLVPTTGLWLGEGVTLYYADALARRAGIAESLAPRVDHLRELLERYAGAAWRGTVSPEGSSLAFGTAQSLNPQATGGYYLQGELLGLALDAAVRDSTREARGLDDVMRVLFQQSAGGRGFTSAELERTASTVCGCRLNALFTTQVRGANPIDLSPALRRVGLFATVDTAPALDGAGAALPDVRIFPDFQRPGPSVYLVVNPLGAWQRAGLRTGDQLVTLQHVSATRPDSVNAQFRRLRIGDTADVEVTRGATRLAVQVPVTGFTRPRVRLMEDPAATPQQRARRERWAGGY